MRTGAWGGLSAGQGAASTCHADPFPPPKPHGMSGAANSALKSTAV